MSNKIKGVSRNGQEEGHAEPQRPQRKAKKWIMYLNQDLTAFLGELCFMAALSQEQATSLRENDLHDSRGVSAMIDTAITPTHAVISPLKKPGRGSNVLLNPYKTDCYILALLLL